MVLLVQFAESGIGNVGIDLGGTDVAVPQKQLHDAQIGTVV